MVTLECVEKLIRKDMMDPVTGDKLKEKDIIVLQRVRESVCLNKLSPTALSSHIHICVNCVCFVC